MAVRRALLVGAVASLAAGCVAVGSGGEGTVSSRVQVPLHGTVPAAGRTTVELANLAGRVTVRGVESGDRIELTGTVHAGGGSDSGARDTAGLVDLAITEDGDTVRLHVAYPVDRHDRFHYPGGGDGVHGLLAFLGGGRTSFSYMDRRVTVFDSPRDDAPTLWADLEVRVPASLAVAVDLGVGAVDVRGITGGLTVHNAAGDIVVEETAGRLAVETGSGDVRLARHEGDADVDTGSGDVRVGEVRGDVAARTGSGDVELRQVDGASIVVSTGSGDVDMDRVSGALRCSTGSGDVRGRRLRLGAALEVGTGSGDVDLEGDLAEVSGVDLHTGSGDILLSLSGGLPPLDLVAETDSGDAEVDGLEIVTRRERRVQARHGDASVPARVQAGSGDAVVRVRES